MDGALVERGSQFGQRQRIEHPLTYAVNDLPASRLRIPQVPTGSLWAELSRRNEQFDVRGGQNLPWLVAFEDVGRPKTVYRIEPGQLAVRFGSGYGLRCVFLQPTDKPVGRNIEERLSWVPHYLNERSSFPAPKT